ncbi:hypothetical protein K1X76_04205, partial [bacterium]|nr:hypothetical protein [bacterium]
PTLTNLTPAPKITQSDTPISVAEVVAGFGLNELALRESIPELADYLDWAEASGLQVRFVNDDEGEGVGHSLPNQQITINRNAAVLRGDPLVLVQTLVHEIVHHQTQMEWSNLKGDALLERIQELAPDVTSLEVFWANSDLQKAFFVESQLQSELAAYEADMRMAAQLERFRHPGTTLSATLPDGRTVSITSQDFLSDPDAARANLATWLMNHQFTNEGHTVTYQQYYETMFDGWMRYSRDSGTVAAPTSMANLMAAPPQSPEYKGIGIGSSNRPGVHVADDGSYVVMDGNFGDYTFTSDNGQISAYGVTNLGIPKSSKQFTEDGLAIIKVRDNNVDGGELVYQISIDGMGGTPQAHQAMQATLAYLTMLLQAGESVEEALAGTQKILKDDGYTGSIALGIDRLTPQPNGTVLLETWTYGDVRGVVFRPGEGEVFRTHDASLVQFLRDMQANNIAPNMVTHTNIQEWVQQHYPGDTAMENRMKKMMENARRRYTPVIPSVENDFDQGKHPLGYVVLTSFGANSLGRPYYQKFIMQPGDRYVRGSDGLWDNATASDVESLVTDRLQGDAGVTLNDVVMENMQNGDLQARPDNYHFILTDVAALPSTP